MGSGSSASDPRTGAERKGWPKNSLSVSGGVSGCAARGRSNGEGLLYGLWRRWDITVTKGR